MSADDLCNMEVSRLLVNRLKWSSILQHTKFEGVPKYPAAPKKTCQVVI